MHTHKCNHSALPAGNHSRLDSISHPHSTDGSLCCPRHPDFTSYFVLSVFWKIPAVQPNRWGKLSTATQIFLIFLTLLNSVLLPWIHNTLLASSLMYFVWLYCGACALASGISYPVRLDRLFSTKSVSRGVPKTE